MMPLSSGVRRSLHLSPQLLCVNLSFALN
jgi:hypothetical protein